MKKAVLVLAILLLAGSSVAQAEMGVGVDWHGSSLLPVMVLPIKMQSGFIIEPLVGFNRTQTNISYLPYEFSASADASKPAVTFIDLGVRLEKELTGNGNAKPVFGGQALVELGSPSNISSGGNDLDSWTDFSFGIYLGGKASVVDGLDVVGGWGPMITLIGKRTAGNIDLTDSATNISSQAFITFRWWLWGM